MVTNVGSISLGSFNESCCGVNRAMIQQNELSDHSAVVAVYAVCGFSNLSAIGVQLACLGTLAPSRRKDLSEIAFSALGAGSIACFSTACVAALMYEVREDEL